MVFHDQYAAAYDALYQDKDYEKECAYIEALFTKYGYRPKTILDLGCGTGGHALLLAKRGYTVTGVDRSPSMLDIARRKAKAEGCAVEFIEGDITGISFPQKFDAVISMFAVMGYQTTNSALAAACNAAKSALVPGGLFLFDCWHGTAVLADRPAPRIKEIDSGRGERIVRFTLPAVDEMRHIVTVNFKVWRITGNGFAEANESHPMRYLFPQEIRYYLEVAGFTGVDFYPFLGLDAELTVNDWNMMVVGR
jgi:SAM-dependent methyltransferase